MGSKQFSISGTFPDVGYQTDVITVSWPDNTDVTDEGIHIPITITRSTSKTGVGFKFQVSIDFLPAYIEEPEGYDGGRFGTAVDIELPASFENLNASVSQTETLYVPLDWMTQLQAGNRHAFDIYCFNAEPIKSGWSSSAVVYYPADHQWFYQASAGYIRFTEACLELVPEIGIVTVEDAVETPWENSGSKLIQNLSRAKVTISSVDTKYGTLVKSYSIKFPNSGESYNGSTATSNIITTAGYIMVELKVTDYRDLSGSMMFPLTVVPYNYPSIGATVAYRCDEDGNDADDGQYITAWFEYAYSPVIMDEDEGPLNSVETAILCRKKGTELWQTLTTGIESGEHRILTRDGGFSTDDQYEIEFLVGDQVYTTTAIRDIDIAYYTMDFLDGGKGIAMGVPATKEGFECGMSAQFDESVETHKEVTGHSFIKVVEDDSWLAFQHFSREKLSDARDSTFRNYPLTWNDADGRETGYLQNNYYKDGGVSAILMAKQPGGVYTNAIETAVNADGGQWYWVSNPASFREAISSLGAKYESSYWGMTDPSGSDSSYIRTTQQGIIPYQSGGSGSVGTSYWPFSQIHSNAYYKGGAVMTGLNSLWSGTVSRGGKIAVTNWHKYRLFVCRLGSALTSNVCLVGATHGSGAYANFSNIFNNGTYTWTMQATFYINDATYWTLTQAAHHYLNTQGNLTGTEDSVVQIYGVV